MRTCADENKLIFGKLINEQPVRFDVAFPTILPFATKQMRPVPGSQWSSGLKIVNNTAQLVYLFAAFAGKLDITVKPFANNEGTHRASYLIVFK